jgi:hypothetical protein
MESRGAHTELTASRPYIIKKEKICILIDVEIPAEKNIMQKEAENQLKYKILCIDIQRM